MPNSTQMVESSSSAVAHSGFASAHLSGKQDETTIAFKAIEKVGQSFLVALAHVEVTRIRCNGERGFCKTKMILVHGSHDFYTSSRREGDAKLQPGY